MKTQIKEHYDHDVCPKCAAASVPCDNVPDQALRGCPKCQHTWTENLDKPATKKLFTDDDMKDWKAYERVRKGGRYNMFDPRARRATGLSGERYSFVMKNFTKLKAAVVEGRGI